MNLNDPKLTAYALEELDEIERQAVAREVNASPEAQCQIQETQAMARLLRAGFAAELEHRQDADATRKSLGESVVTNQGDLIRLIEEKAKSGVFLSVLGVAMTI